MVTGQKGIDFILATACPVCASPRFKPLKKATFNIALLDERRIRITDSDYGKVWDLSACADCGHIFANPYPRPEFMTSLYGRVEDPSYEEESEGRSRNFLSILKTLEKLRPAKGTLFDVGAATGILLRLARDRGWNVSGVEPSAWAVARAEQTHGLRLVRGAFENISLPAELCQAVTMVDFIEHTPIPREAVAKARAVLAPGGILCLVTPDIHSLAARLAGQRWWHHRAGHLAYFSEKSLAALLAGAGFTILLRRRYGWTFSAHYILSRFRVLAPVLEGRRTSSFLKRIRIKLALGDSFEIYARKGQRP